MQSQDLSLSTDWFEDPSLHSSSFSAQLELPEGQFMLLNLSDASPTDEVASHITDTHKQSSSPSISSLPNSPSENETDFVITSEESAEASLLSQTSESESSKTSSQKTKKVKKTFKRKDDNNNAHKKFITALNKVLKDFKVLSRLKAILKKANVPFDKGSRHSFVIRLIDAKNLLNDSELVKFLKKYCIQIKKRFTKKQTEVDCLLEQLVPYYTASCEHFEKGKLREAVEVLYDIPGAKEDQYREKGIQKVLAYRSPDLNGS